MLVHIPVAALYDKSHFLQISYFVLRSPLLILLAARKQEQQDLQNPANCRLLAMVSGVVTIPLQIET